MADNTSYHTIPFLQSRVAAWSETESRTHLPWRADHLSAYKIWVSEVMLQQTQVSRVIPYYTRFLERFPTVELLAAATWEEFLPFYAGLGYYRRGRNMLATAKEVVEKYGGKFPQDEVILRQLPGVGPYTARAILAFAYGQPKLAFDTNLQRVLGRFFFGDKKAAIDVEFLDSKVDDHANLSSSLMDFANAVCLKKPRCEVCPLASECEYRITHGEAEEISLTKRSTFPLKSAQVILFLHENHKTYFSSTTDEYQPFILASPLNTRHRIQDYFRRTYGLELAVRPHSEQGFLDETPTIFVNAQILLGTQSFATFFKAEAQTWKSNHPLEVE